ncbi:MAG: hypothetical protein PF445_03195 [Melioribacteraceae bacterium]|jgi:hypothetical protein|nr:hypothetical protein [Melioribacteraceae bacterium]
MCNRLVSKNPNIVDPDVYLSLLTPPLFKLTNHRKIPCSKYSGRLILFFEDVFCFSEVPPIDEDVEPP